MRPHLPGEDAEAGRVQQRAHVLQGVERAQRHAHAHAVLVARGGQRVLVEQGFGLVDDPVTLFAHAQRLHEVGQLVGAHGPVERAADGIDAAVHADDRTELRLPGAQLVLVAHVGRAALSAQRAVGRLVDHAAGDVADVAVGEALDQPGDGVGRVQRIGVGEDDDLARGPRHRQVQRAGLAGAGLLPHQLDAAAADRPHQFVGAVLRGVRHDDDVQLPGRVVLRQLVADGRLDVAGLVERGDQDGHRRLVRAAGRPLDAAVQHRTREPRQQGIARVHIHQARQAQPEHGNPEQTAASLGVAGSRHGPVCGYRPAASPS